MWVLHHWTKRETIYAYTRERGNLFTTDLACDLVGASWGFLETIVSHRIFNRIYDTYLNVDSVIQ